MDGIGNMLQKLYEILALKIYKKILMELHYYITMYFL